MDIPLGAVLGTFGVERWRITWRGQAAHAGSTPMDKRRDALAGAAKLALELREIAARVGNGAVCTSGGVVCLARHRHVRRRDRRAAPRPPSSRRRRPRRAAPAGPGGERALRGRGTDRRRLGADLEHRADPLRSRADRPLRRGLPRCRRHLTSVAVGAAARRRRGCACGRPDGDALRAEPTRALAHEARGHARRASRARGRGARPTRRRDHRQSVRLSEPGPVCPARGVGARPGVR